MAKELAGTTLGAQASVPETFGSPRCSARPRSSVLIVDEDVELAVRYQKGLEAYGYAVDRVLPEELAARAASGKHYDVIVGDIGDDDAALRVLRNCGPVVLLSHGLAFASARAALRCGAYRYLLKPVSDECLLEVLVETIRDTAPRSAV